MVEAHKFSDLYKSVTNYWVILNFISLSFAKYCIYNNRSVGDHSFSASVFLVPSKYQHSRKLMICASNSFKS